MPFYLVFRFQELLKPFSVTLGLSRFNLVHSKEQGPFRLLGGCWELDLSWLAFSPCLVPLCSLSLTLYCRLERYVDKLWTKKLKGFLWSPWTFHASLRLVAMPIIFLDWNIIENTLFVITPHICRVHLRFLVCYVSVVTSKCKSLKSEKWKAGINHHPSWRLYLLA